ncbi:carboxymuconolactone decarboxylase family protein [Gryllotalpicola protaetiae]|uniref:Carboxymuconolactone decarboxylase family protein n=1 Tax=Gryllotalpicola protaetiae TaxID=2419771 RepID=A0A387C006_9MICO|nr:carboxymuconolactone decarboxylase family protein [Gryllotalpicola protaetiae]AYG03911.1 carboxymuconolactone decarboxylase family protein [Gryllotalpicola protaetiae]
MEPRIKHPVATLPGALKALQALSMSAENAGLSSQLRELVSLRASQVNGCSFCVLDHSTRLKNAGESDDRIFAVAAWRDAPHFTGAERAALALSEAVTRLSDRPDPVPDSIWQAAADNFTESELAGLLVTIASINVWNRLNVAVHQVAGTW